MADQGVALRLARAGQTAWQRGDRDGYAAIFADDATWTNADGEEIHRGRDSVVEYLAAVRAAWTDPVLEVSQAFGDDTQCVTVGRFRGTHTGDLPTPAGPLPPTGKSVDTPLCQVITAKDGKVTSVTWYNQVMYTLIQLGLAPAPEAAHS
jgi:ketosteroid isomerase-like protein